MDAAVGDQALDGQPGDLAADAVEGRQHHRLGRVVDDDVDAGEVLERADVAALAADDAALEVVGGELDHRHRGLGGVPRGGALDRDRQDVPGAPVGLELGLLLDAPDQLGHLLAAVSSVRASRRSRAWAAVMLGDPLELGQLGVAGGLELLLELLGVHVAVGDRLLAAGELLVALSRLAVAGGQAFLELGDLGAPVGRSRARFRSAGRAVLRGGDASLLHLRVGFAAGVLEDPSASRWASASRPRRRACATDAGDDPATSASAIRTAPPRLLMSVAADRRRGSD